MWLYNNLWNESPVVLFDNEINNWRRYWYKGIQIDKRLITLHIERKRKIETIERREKETIRRREKTTIEFEISRRVEEIWRRKDEICIRIIYLDRDTKRISSFFRYISYLWLYWTKSWIIWLIWSYTALNLDKLILSERNK